MPERSIGAAWKAVVAFVARGFESRTLRNFPDMAQWLAQVAYIHKVGGSSPSIGTNSDVDEWFSHHADTVGAFAQRGFESHRHY